MFILATFTQIIALKDEVAGTFTCKIVKGVFEAVYKNLKVQLQITSNGNLAFQDEDNDNIGDVGETS